MGDEAICLWIKDDDCHRIDKNMRHWDDKLGSSNSMMVNCTFFLLKNDQNFYFKFRIFFLYLFLTLFPVSDMNRTEILDYLGLCFRMLNKITVCGCF